MFYHRSYLQYDSILYSIIATAYVVCSLKFCDVAYTCPNMQYGKLHRAAL